MTVAGFTTTCPVCKVPHDRPGSVCCETDGCRVVRFASSYEAKLKAIAAIQRGFSRRTEEPCPKCGIRTGAGTGTALACCASGCRVIEFVPEAMA